MPDEDISLKVSNEEVVATERLLSFAAMRQVKDANDGDVDPGDIEYLEDRLLIMEGKPQLYGTQFYTIDGVTKPFPIEDPDHVDERRTHAGLDTYAENVTRITAKHRS